MKTAPLLDSIWAVNFFLGVNAVTKKFRLLAVEAFKGLIHPSFLDRYIVLKGMPASLSSRPKQV